MPPKTEHSLVESAILVHGLGLQGLAGVVSMSLSLSGAESPESVSVSLSGADVSEVSASSSVCSDTASASSGVESPESVSASLSNTESPLSGVVASASLSFCSGSYINVADIDFADVAA